MVGGIDSFIHYGIRLIYPQYFVLQPCNNLAFASALLGTSFGTVSTVGVLMIVAKGADINPHLIAGAIIYGIYFGDRCSMSSSANLVATLLKLSSLTRI